MKRFKIEDVGSRGSYLSLQYKMLQYIEYERQTENDALLQRE